MTKRRSELPAVYATPFDEVVRRRFNRREVVAGALGGAAVLGVSALFGCSTSQPGRTAARSGKVVHAGFSPIGASSEDAVRLPAGYVHDVLLRWGDPIFPETPALDPAAVLRGSLLEPNATADQLRQFGYNCDAVHFFALPGSRDHGLLAVNHEYVNDELMFPGITGSLRDGGERRRAYFAQHPQIVAYGLAAHGVSVVEVMREKGQWRVVTSSKRNRRITGTTPIEISGPAAGSGLLRTSEDPTGRLAAGTLGNCAGGRTPWGTYLTAEENVYDYFGDGAQMLRSGGVDPQIKFAHKRFRMRPKGSVYTWEAVEPRFSYAKEPKEVLRFGWIVEIDPYDPTARPKKRTALGRFCHEAATTTLARDGRVAVYMGDDEMFEYLYKFVSRDRYDPKRPETGRDLLDNGTLYVARLDSDGTGQWLPLVHEPGGPLDDETLFRSQADVLILARAAADRLGATPMDRPEDIEVNPLTGRVYVACTKNPDRQAESVRKEYLGREIDVGIDAANPRPDNRWGHIVELIEHGDDAGSLTFSWNILLLAGDPSRGRLLARYEDLAKGPLGADDSFFGGQAEPGGLAAIGAPDNLAFDAAGNLWIVTDGDQPGGGNNGCFVCPADGPNRGQLKRFMTGPVGAEVGGCSFTPDGDTLFLSIQHPGEGGTLEKPTSSWPDGPGCAPRPSLIAVRREDGGPL